MSQPAKTTRTRFVRACLGESVDRVPVWLMRQAGRFLPEYQALKSKVDFLTLCRDPELASQATLDAARVLETDAAIIFSDITLPGAAMGLDLSFSPGPSFSPPVRTRADVEALRKVDPQRDLGFVLDAIRRTRARLPDDISLIGFVGAPLTLAAYLVEGTPGHGWPELKKLLYGDPATAHALLTRVTETVVAHARAQVDAGCDALQLFDSSAGELAAEELRTFAFTYARQAIAALVPLGVPIIYFARNIGAHLEAAAGLGAHVLGLDWTVSVTDARRRLRDQVGLMGNLDPAVLLTTKDEIEGRVRTILRQAEGLDAFVFNLGHGVLPATPPDHARHLVLSVKRHGLRGGPSGRPSVSSGRGAK